MAMLVLVPMVTVLSRSPPTVTPLIVPTAIRLTAPLPSACTVSRSMVVRLVRLPRTAVFSMVLACTAVGTVPPALGMAMSLICRSLVRRPPTATPPSLGTLTSTAAGRNAIRPRQNPRVAARFRRPGSLDGMNRLQVMRGSTALAWSEPCAEMPGCPGWKKSRLDCRPRRRSIRTRHSQAFTAACSQHCDQGRAGSVIAVTVGLRAIARVSGGSGSDCR